MISYSNLQVQEVVLHDVNFPETYKVWSICVWIKLNNHVTDCNCRAVLCGLYLVICVLVFVISLYAKLNNINLANIIINTNDDEQQNPFIDAFLSHEVELRRHIFIKKNDKYHYFSFCTSMLVNTGLGNRLGAYWLNRALSFWWNIPFKFNEKCTCTKYDHYFCRKTNPNKANITINGTPSALLSLGTGFRPEISGYENILLNGVMLGFSEEEVKKT